LYIVNAPAVDIGESCRAAARRPLRSPYPRGPGVSIPSAIPPGGAAPARAPGEGDGSVDNAS